MIGKLFNLRRVLAKSKVQTEVLDEFLFADDMTKGAPTEEKMQKRVDQVYDSCDSYDLTISIRKTEVVYQLAPGKPYKEPTITVKGQRLQVVDKFTYLGSTLSRIPDTEVLKRAGMQSVHTLLKSFAKENPLWRTRNGLTLSCWSEEAIQKHPQSLPQGFQHTNSVMGINCTGPSKVARPHQKRC